MIKREVENAREVIVLDISNKGSAIAKPEPLNTVEMLKVCYFPLCSIYIIIVGILPFRIWPSTSYETSRETLFRGLYNISKDRVDYLSLEL